MKNKERVFIILDGSNFYHRLKEPAVNFAHLIDFNCTKFIQWLAGDKKIIAMNYYIGIVRAKPNQPKSQELRRQQQRLFARLQRDGWKISRGFILDIDGRYHEKGVDVQMAVDILVGAYENLYDRVLLVSSDTDLLPAITKAKTLGKTIEYVGFSHKPSFALIRHASLSKLLSKEDLTPFIGK